MPDGGGVFAVDAHLLPSLFGGRLVHTLKRAITSMSLGLRFVLLTLIPKHDQFSTYTFCSSV